MELFQHDLKRFQEGWKCFWVIFETLKKFTSPKIGNASNSIGNAYNNDGIIPSKLDTFKHDLKRFQEGWKNSQVQKLGMLPTGLETNPTGLEMLYIHRRFGNDYNNDGIVPIYFLAKFREAT